MRLVLALLVGLCAAAQDEPKIFFSKTFPGSRPAYLEIRLERGGRAEYREGPDEDNPVVLKLAKDETDPIYALADKLGHFSRELESGLKVARMGEKLLRWELGAEKHEAKFNYSVDPDAQAIHDWFERISESATYFIDLERAAKYDKLGVNVALLKLESAWDRRRLVALPLFLPLLDRVDKNEAYLHMARERAARLAATFRNPPPPAAVKP